MMLNYIWFVSFSITLLSICSNVSCDVSFKSCTKVTSCSCQTDEGEIIDLSPLTSTTDKAKFADVKGSTGDLFSWNPCNDFIENPNGCKNVAACQIQASQPPALFSLGDQKSAAFKLNDKKMLQVYYSDKSDPNFARTAYVTLICDQALAGILTAEGETPSGTGNYYMTLKSKYACPVTAESPASNSLTIGSILLIVVLVIVIVYIIAGLSVNKYARKATGREIIPNYVFWTALPGFIKEGVLFTMSGCKRGSAMKFDNI